MGQPTYSIIIPAYNESLRLGATLEAILAYAKQKRWEWELIVVDDGSRDNTKEIVQAYIQKNSRVRLLENPGNRGKGYSVRNGMLQGKGEILLFSDADLSSPIDEAEKLFMAIHNGADIAIGSRWLNPTLLTRKQPIYRRVLSRIFNISLRLVLRLKFKDTQCGFKAFSRQSAQAIFPPQKVERWGFDPEIIYVAQRLGFRIAEVPVRWAHSAGTRLHPIRDGIHAFWDVLTIRWNALRGVYGEKRKI